MKLTITIILSIFVSNLTLGQIKTDNINPTKDSTKLLYKTYENLEDLENQKEELKIEQLFYIDSTFKFKIAIHDWYEIVETGTPYVFAGSLPKVEGIENIIAIKSFDKSKNSFEDFEEYIVKHMVFGKNVNWSKGHTSMGKKELNEYSEIGKSYKVYLMHNKLMYHCQYVLTETETAYIWIDFTATEETFDKNKNKFDEFMTGFEIIE